MRLYAYVKTIRRPSYTRIRTRIHTVHVNIYIGPKISQHSQSNRNVHTVDIDLIRALPHSVSVCILLLFVLITEAGYTIPEHFPIIRKFADLSQPHLFLIQAILSASCELWICCWFEVADFAEGKCHRADMNMPMMGILFKCWSFAIRIIQSSLFQQSQSKLLII